MTNNKHISNRANKLAKFIYREIEGLNRVGISLGDEFFKSLKDGIILSRAFDIRDKMHLICVKKAKYREIASLLKLLSIEIRNK